MTPLRFPGLKYRLEHSLQGLGDHRGGGRCENDSLHGEWIGKGSLSPLSYDPGVGEMLIYAYPLWAVVPFPLSSYTT